MTTRNDNMVPAGNNLIRPFHKMGYYSGNLLRSLVPVSVWQRRRQALLDDFQRQSPEEQAVIEARVAYYNRVQAQFSLPATAERIGDFSFAGKSTAYCCDFRNLIRCFSPELRVSYLFGDITEVPETPRFVKSRPIREDRSNANSILLKLNTVRHYRFVRDRLAFSEKKPKAVWRGKSNQRHRIEFADTYVNHPLCDVGCTLHKEKGPQSYHRDFLSVQEQLQYQFVLSIEGVDVATNLKWIMASNSLCLMRRPRFETWFMEGTLIPDYHYVQLKDDHSDLIEKIEYYREHPAEAEAIVANASRYVAPFLNERTESLIAMLVIEKYLQLSGQSGGEFN